MDGQAAGDCIGIGENVSAGASGNSLAEMLVGRDHHFLAAGLQEVKRRFNFWTHISRREVSCYVMLLEI